MAKKAAPAKLTGGAGFRYEDLVAARLLLDMLGGMNSLGEGFGRIAHLDWQARDAGWHADDLAIRCDVCGTERSAGFSIKSDRQVTASGFPRHFVTAAWEHWLGIGGARALRRDQDAIVLITGPLAAGVEEAWQKTLREALETTPERMVARLAPPSSSGGQPQSSEAQRALFASLCCPTGLPGSPPAADDAETVRVLRHLRLLHFDYESSTSRDVGRAIGDAQRLLVSGNADEGRALWRRLIDFAAEQRSTGGATDLPKLLAALRGTFTIASHPDHCADWLRLRERSVARMADVRDAITGLGPILREAEAGEVRSRIGTPGVCLITGESCCGKSALAKRSSQAEPGCVLWFEADDLQHHDDISFRRDLGLANDLTEILVASPTDCLVVLDGVEHCSRLGLQLAGRLIRGVRTAQNGGHVRFLLTCQAEASGRVTRTLVECGVDPGLLQPYQLEKPVLEQIRDMLHPVPTLRWASFRPELQELLTNLKVLDLVVQAATTAGGFDPTGTTTLSALIDRLWGQWVEGDEGNVSTSHLLMQLGMQEADSLTAGVPRIRLGFPEQQALPGLVRAALVRLRGERVLFTHDLLGDWARLRVCIGQDPTVAPAERARAASPRWHRAVRLYAQRLLELDGVEAWREALRRADDGSDTGTVLRDLLLEGVFLAGSARTLFTTAWPILAADGGRLLCRLLDRFLIVATLPDPRLTEVLGADASRYEHLYRIPLLTYWAPVLAALHARRAEVAWLAPGVETRLWRERRPDLDKQEAPPRRLDAVADADSRAPAARPLEFDAYEVFRGRGIIAFELELVSGQAVLLIQQLPSGNDYAAVRETIQEELQPMMDVRSFQPVRVGRSIVPVAELEGVRRRQMEHTTERGSRINYVSAERDADAFSDPTLEQARRGAGSSVVGRMGNFYWRLADAAREIHVKVYALDQRVGFFGECAETEVRNVLRLVRQHSR